MKVVAIVLLLTATCWASSRRGPTLRDLYERLAAKQKETRVTARKLAYEADTASCLLDTTNPGSEDDWNRVNRENEDLHAAIKAYWGAVNDEREVADEINQARDTSRRDDSP